ncbi:MAG TPA: ribonuclease H-like domain-containing protein [Chloroflexota bacterium]
MKLAQLERHGLLGRANRSRTAEGENGPAIGKNQVQIARRDAYTLEDVVYEPGRYHGRHAPWEVRALDPAFFSLACRDESLKSARLENAVFLDTETTGLGLGTGTYAFLVGAGFWAEEGFTVRQFFLEGPQHERVFLARLTEFLDVFEAVVTFNGKAFDWPLLENRFVLHRSRMPLRDAAHVDLLHVSRRLWKRRLPSCSLGSLEGHLLGVRRTEQDVPGYLIPEIYFRFVQSGDAEPLQRVFYHNAQDILSLATLSLHIQSVLGAPENSVQFPEDWLSLGKLYERCGDEARAALCFEQAAEAGLRYPVACEALLALSRLHKRARQWEQAVRAWKRLAQTAGPASIVARTELAKYYEHVERNYLEAIGHVQYALEVSELFGASSLFETRRQLDTRLARLVKRSMLERSRPSGGAYR